MGWLLTHLTGELGGGLLSVATHVATSGFGWLKERTKAGELANVEQAAVQRASYHRADWEHLVLALVVIGLMVWAAVTGQTEDLQAVTRGMALASVAWFTGRLTLRGLR